MKQNYTSLAAGVLEPGQTAVKGSLPLSKGLISETSSWAAFKRLQCRGSINLRHTPNKRSIIHLCSCHFQTTKKIRYRRFRAPGAALSNTLYTSPKKTERMMK